VTLKNKKSGCKISLLSLLIGSIVAAIVSALGLLFILNVLQPRNEAEFLSHTSILALITAGVWYIVFRWIAPPWLEKKFKAQYLASLPVDARQHLDQAYLAEEEDDFENALRECDLALQFAPNWAEAHNLRGIVLEALDRTEEAIAAYREAIRLEPGFDDARRNLREATAEAGVE
jgi:tetratricopeptide (TPR) repeat protein